jgi:CTP:molybdopterin cytidylyltransferase MocA
MENKKTTAIILAAGFSSRMGDFKPLLDIGGRPALIRLLGSIAEAGLVSVCIVTGYARERIEAAVRRWDSPSALSVDVVYNERFEDGMFSSVRTGLRFARAQHADQALIFPADTPLIRADSIASVISASNDAPGSFVVACCCGKKGHPLLIPMKYADGIIDCPDGGGLRAVTDRYDDEDLLLRAETADEGTVLDMDTPEGYAELLRYYERNGDEETTVINTLL